MGPRSWDRGEGIQPLRVRLLLALASMGPRSWDRGEIRYLDQGSRVSPLQWGRGLGTAESSLPHGHDCTERMASMGPRSWDRGEHGPRLGAVGHALASMGPRSWDRGEGRERQPRENAALLLQWGRGLGAAESECHVVEGMNPPTCFNGAAVLGPRRARRCARRASRASRFNGAAVLGPRRASPSARSAPARFRFNGAAVLGPRRVADRRRALLAPGASMGPRSWDRGEGVWVNRS